MSQCNQTFDALARSLGDFTCQDAPAVVHLRSPFALSNWTLPVLELMMVAGAVLALWWAPPSKPSATGSPRTSTTAPTNGLYRTWFCG